MTHLWFMTSQPSVRHIKMYFMELFKGFEQEEKRLNSNQHYIDHAATRRRSTEHLTYRISPRLSICAGERVGTSPGVWWGQPGTAGSVRRWWPADDGGLSLSCPTLSAERIRPEPSETAPTPSERNNKLTVWTHSLISLTCDDLNTFKRLLAKSSTTSVLNWSWFLLRKLWTCKIETWLNKKRLPIGWFLTTQQYFVSNLIGNGAGVVIHGEDWQRVLGFGVKGAVTMVIVALLEEGVVSGLVKNRWQCFMFICQM